MKSGLRLITLILIVGLGIAVGLLKAESLSSGRELRYVSGQIIVKFKPDAGKEIDRNLASGKILNKVSERDSLNKLNAKYNVLEMRKLFKGQRSIRDDKALSLSTQEKAERIRGKFPERTRRAPKRAKVPDLSHIYIISFPKDANILGACAEYSQDPNVEYAEPDYILQTDDTFPNDPYFYKQWALSNTGQAGATLDADIDAPEAWDVSDGEGVVIAIVDTGVDWDHPDLAENIWMNIDESLGDANGDGYPGIMGVDDDGDGLIDEDSAGREPGDPGYTNDLSDDDDENDYVDDIRGWDFVTVGSADVWPGEDPDPEDNNPMDFHGHGTHCSGIAAARGYNNTGVIGISWIAQIMALRAGYKAINGKGYLQTSDCCNAIYYAANNGADVMNCSWGSGSFSESLSEAIQYAYSLGVITVAAAGNSNSQNFHYSAAYEHVISVAATDHEDRKASFSNYGDWIDISAPGVNIYSTLCDDDYDYKNGTSMASPLVTGTVALIIAQFPGFTNEEVIGQLLNGADGLNDVNPDYQNLLGSGRVNAYQTLISDEEPNIGLIEVEIDDSLGNNNQALDPGETIALVVAFKNTWGDATGVVARLTTPDNYVEIANDTFYVGTLLSGETSENSSTPFVFTIDANCPENHYITFNVVIEADNNYCNIEPYFALCAETLSFHAIRLTDNLWDYGDGEGPQWYDAKPSQAQVDGDDVVWFTLPRPEGYNNNQEIYMYTYPDELTEITNISNDWGGSDKSDVKPRLDNGQIVWNKGGERLYCYDGNSTYAVLSTGASYSDYRIANGKIVWHQYWGDTDTRGIYLHDISTRETRRIVKSYGHPPEGATTGWYLKGPVSPEIDDSGNVAFAAYAWYYKDDSWHQTDQNDVYLYSAGIARITYTPAVEEKNLAISDGNIAWSAWSNGSYKVYRKKHGEDIELIRQAEGYIYEVKIDHSGNVVWIEYAGVDDGVYCIHNVYIYKDNAQVSIKIGRGTCTGVVDIDHGKVVWLTITEWEGQTYELMYYDGNSNYRMNEIHDLEGWLEMYYLVAGNRGGPQISDDGERVKITWIAQPTAEWNEYGGGEYALHLFVEEISSPVFALSGTVTLEYVGWSQGSAEIMYQVREPGLPPTKPLYEGTMTVSMTTGYPAFGDFSITGIANGIYDVALKYYNHVADMVQEVVVEGGDVAGLVLTLWAGDADGDDNVFTVEATTPSDPEGDNDVDLTDYYTLFYQYHGGLPVTTGYNSDFNCDGIIDLDDYWGLYYGYQNNPNPGNWYFAP